MEEKSNTETRKRSSRTKVKNVKFNTQFDPEYQGDPGRELDPVSMTEPDLSLTVAQLLENHVRGKSLGVAHNEGEYFEEHEIPIFEDLTDVQEYLDDLEEQKSEVQAELDRIKKLPSKQQEEELRKFNETLAEEERRERAKLELEKRRLSKPTSKEP